MTLACPVACTGLMKSCRLSIRPFNSVSHKYRFLTCYSLACWVDLVTEDRLTFHRPIHSPNGHNYLG